MLSNFSLSATLLLFLLSSFLFAQNDSLSSEISLKTYLEEDSVPLNQEVVYHVELSWEGDLSRFSIGEIGEPVITNLSLRGSGSSNRITTSKNGKPLSIKRVTYYLKPLSIGMAYIDGLSIQYKENSSAKSETLFAQRIGVKIIDPVASDKDAFMPGTILLWILLIGFLAALAYFIFRYMQRRPKQEADAPQQSIEEKYLELQSETIHIANRASKENISDMSKLLAGYISEKFAITDKVDMPVIKEKLAHLKIEEELIQKISQMYEKAELARFAGEQVDIAEMHMFFDTIEHILSKINKDEKNRGE
jgi:hypothetical protein